MILDTTATIYHRSHRAEKGTGLDTCWEGQPQISNSPLGNITRLFSLCPDYTSASSSVAMHETQQKNRVESRAQSHATYSPAATRVAYRSMPPTCRRNISPPDRLPAPLALSTPASSSSTCFFAALSFRPIWPTLRRRSRPQQTRSA